MPSGPEIIASSKIHQIHLSSTDLPLFLRIPNMECFIAKLRLTWSQPIRTKNNYIPDFELSTTSCLGKNHATSLHDPFPRFDQWTAFHLTCGVLRFWDPSPKKSQLKLPITRLPHAPLVLLSNPSFASPWAMPYCLPSYKQGHRHHDPCVCHWYPTAWIRSKV